MISYALSYTFILLLGITNINAGELTSYTSPTPQYGTQIESASQYSILNSENILYTGGSIGSSLHGKTQHNNALKYYMESQDKEKNDDIILMSLDTQKTVPSYWSSFIKYALTGSLLGYLYSYIYPNRLSSWQCALAGGAAGTTACAIINMARKYQAPQISLPVNIFKINPKIQKYNVYSYKLSPHSTSIQNFVLEQFMMEWMKALPNIKNYYSSEGDYQAELQKIIPSQPLPATADMTNLSHNPDKILRLLAILQADYEKNNIPSH